MLADVLSGKRALCLTNGGEKRLFAYSSFFVRAEIAVKEGWKPCFSGQEVDVLRGHCMFLAVRL